MDKFQYSPLAGNTIRLIEILPTSQPASISCRIFHQPNYTSDEVRYAALSYCWGDSTPAGFILLNGLTFAVAQNLLDWLVEMSTSRDNRFWWVDAICINQQDILERTAQVQQMGLVYSHAEIVLTWLGPSDDETKFAFAVLTELGTTHGVVDEASGNSYFIERSNERDLDPTGTPATIRAAQRIWKAEYWQRLWVLPEIHNAQALFLRSGNSTISWAHLNFLPPGFEPLTFGTLNIQRLCKPLFARSGSSAAATLSVAFTSWTKQKCADPRDRLFCIAAQQDIDRWDIPVSIPVDYHMTIQEVCTVSLSLFDRVCAEEVQLYKKHLRNPYMYPFEALNAILKWDDAMQFEQYRDWLRTRMLIKTDSKAYVEIASGMSIDCFWPMIQDVLGDGLLMHRSELNEAGYLGHRSWILSARGFDESKIPPYVDENETDDEDDEVQNEDFDSDSEN